MKQNTLNHHKIKTLLSNKIGPITSQHVNKTSQITELNYYMIRNPNSVEE